MGQTNSISGSTILIILAGVVLCMTEETRIRLQVQYEQDHKVVILTCTVDTGTLYISLYNDKTLLARCWITPSLFCRNFLGDRGKFSIDHKINQYTLTISDLKNSIGYWICSHGGRRDTSSSVLIKGSVKPTVCNGTVEPSACKDPVEPKTCKEVSKTYQTLVLILFVVSFVAAWIVIIVIEERMTTNRSPGVFIKCNTKLLSGIKVASTCTLLIGVIIVAYVLDKTTGYKIVGCCLAMIFGCCLPICLQLKTCISQNIEGCCLATFSGCRLPICLRFKPRTSDGDAGNEIEHQGLQDADQN